MAYQYELTGQTHQASQLNLICNPCTEHQLCLHTQCRPVLLLLLLLRVSRSRCMCATIAASAAIAAAIGLLAAASAGRSNSSSNACHIGTQLYTACIVNMLVRFMALSRHFNKTWFIRKKLL